MTDDLLELDSMLADIADMLGQAERMAGEISGADGGRAPIDQIIDKPCLECQGTGVLRKDWNFAPLGLPSSCPACNGKGTFPYRYTDPGEPPVDGWPALVKLAGALGAMSAILKAARAGEVDDAVRAAHDEARDAPEPIAPGDERYYERRTMTDG